MIKFENKTNGRFYYMQITSDLLNECVLRIFYGGSRVTRIRVVACDDRCSLQQIIEKISKRRLKRGYLLVT
jgi:hypothetical protein